jgi:hypothetical protein
MLQGMEQWSQGQIGEEDVRLFYYAETKRKGADGRSLTFM